MFGSSASSALAAASPDPPPDDLSPDDLYVLYTGGTTGMPKGVMYEVGTITGFFLAAGFTGVGQPLPTSADEVPSMVAAPTDSLYHMKRKRKS